MLKKVGVGERGLLTFYQSAVRSILSYAAPCWFPFLSDNDITKLEKYQRLCLRIILPNIEHYRDRLHRAGLDELNVYLSMLCLRYFDKVRKFGNHPLHGHIPHRSYDSRNRPVNINTRRALLSKSIFTSLIN